MKYRPEIDGVRALAVIPVILFHAGFELFSGGFVGVDVFFVISGYLITTILIEDLENKRFSLVYFYERRARRILPALFFVMFVCLPFAWMWMLPNQIKDFSQSLVAVSLFASNIQFWRESGYFEAAAEMKPLLHTWSLAVEEQYYLLFPIFLVLAWRFGKNRVFWMIVLMSAISLLFSEYSWRNHPTANFYLAPTRAWELFAGSITAFMVQKNGVQKNNLRALIGLAAIIFPIFVYDESTPFPSLYTLVPVMGVMLVILYANNQTLSARILSNKAFVGLGLISYSAYLWHQPLFAFTRIRMFEHPSSTVMSVLCVTSLGLAYFSWKFVERPFRSPNKTSRKFIFASSSVGILSFLVMGLYVHYNAKTLIPNYQWADSFAGNHGLGVDCDASILVDFAKCSTKDNPQIAIYGDSHAMHLVDGFGEKVRKNLGLVQMTKSGCSPLLDVAGSDERAGDCLAFNRSTIDFLSSNESIRFVIISSAFGLLVNGADLNFDGKVFTNDAIKREIVKNKFNEIITHLKNSGKTVILFSTTPAPSSGSINPANCFFKAKKHKYDLSRCNFIQQDRYENFGLYVFDKAHLDSLMKVDLTKQICKENICGVEIDNKSVFGRGRHLSKDGTISLSKLFEWDKLVLK